MAKLSIQTNDGAEIKTINVNAHSFKNSPHTLVSLSGLLDEVLKALDETFDRELQSEEAVKTSSI